VFVPAEATIAGEKIFGFGFLRAAAHGRPLRLVEDAGREFV
jgi:hypothetical protein